MHFCADYSDAFGGLDYGDYALPVWWDAGLRVVRVRGFDGFGVGGGAQAGGIYSGWRDIQCFDQDWAGAREVSDEAAG
jgi:hypothetical protein